MRLVLLACLLAVPATARAADQFGLACIGTHEYTFLSTLTDRTEPFRIDFRIDLARKVYCTDPCTAGSRPFREVRDDALVIGESFANDPVHGTQGEYIDRVKGAYVAYTYPIGGRESFRTNAQCTVVPFRPFPIVEKKF